MTHLVRSYEQNLFRFLRQAGYTTVHVGKNDMLSNDSFPLSFDYWMDGQGVNQGADSFPFGVEGYYSFMSQPGSKLGNDSKANADLAAVNHALQVWILLFACRFIVGEVVRDLQLCDCVTGH